MAWFKVDDGFHSSRKLKAIPPRYRFAAAGLWTIAGSWCSQEKTDGHIPNYMIKEWGATPKLVDSLVESGLWSVTRDGYKYHAWLEYNPSKARVEAEREASKARVQASRDKRRGINTGHSPATPNVAAQHPTTETVPRPDPTRPDPTHKEEETPSPQAAKTIPAPHRFVEFWSTYPRRQGKGDALKAYAKALTVTDADTIIDAALAYAQDPNRDDAFTAMASTWLNGARWDDDPLPNRTAPAATASPKLTGREQKWLDAELLKENPDPRALDMMGHPHQQRMLG